MYFSRLAADYFLSHWLHSGRRTLPEPPPGLTFHANGGARMCTAVKIEQHLATLRLLYTRVSIGSATWNWAGPRLTAPHGLSG